MGTTSPARGAAALLPLTYVAFVSLGLPDTILGVAWPSLRDRFDLGQPLLALPLAVGAAAYFTSGLFAGRLLARFGLGALLAGSTGLVACGVIVHGAAPAFAVFVAAAPLVGFGSGALDASLNTWVARHFTSRHMTWLHAAYAVGASAGPALMTAVLTRGLSWRAGYLVIAAAIGGLAIAFATTARRWGDSSAPAPASESGSGGGAWRSAAAWKQIGAFFLYSGVEVTAGAWSFTVLTESRGMEPGRAGAWVTAYWLGLLAGRVLLGFVIERVGPVRLLRVCTTAAAIAAILFAFEELPAAGAFALPLLSFSLAPIYPGLMSETPRRLGAAIAPHAIGLQVSAATIGIVVLPALAGTLGGRVGLHAIPAVTAAGALGLLAVHESILATIDRRLAARR